MYASVIFIIKCGQFCGCFGVIKDKNALYCSVLHKMMFKFMFFCFSVKRSIFKTVVVLIKRKYSSS